MRIADGQHFVDEDELCIMPRKEKKYKSATQRLSKSVIQPGPKKKKTFNGR